MVNCTWNDILESSILGYPVGGFSVRIIFYNYIDIHKANNVLLYSYQSDGAEA